MFFLSRSRGLVREASALVKSAVPPADDVSDGVGVAGNSEFDEYSGC